MFVGQRACPRIHMRNCGSFCHKIKFCIVVFCIFCWYILAACGLVLCVSALCDSEYVQYAHMPVCIFRVGALIHSCTCVCVFMCIFDHL